MHLFILCKYRQKKASQLLKRLMISLHSTLSQIHKMGLRKLAGKDQNRKKQLRTEMMKKEEKKKLKMLKQMKVIKMKV